MDSLYNDLAIILAWPDATIRGDESWMMFFRKIGLVKNLNFRVGHTAVILVDPETRGLHYYDFGRYISPRGFGRVRSSFSDPRLRLHTKAVIDDAQSGIIRNLLEIAEELDSIKEATQGEGRMYFSVATGINFQRARTYADQLIQQGSSPYGAFARGNNNCSRFITRMLMKASKKYHFFHGVNFPETFKASPMSNVINVRPDRQIFIHQENAGLRRIRMSRTQSFFFILGQLKDNFSRKRAVSLPCDQFPGSVAQKTQPDTVPTGAQWLGGVCSGAWYHVLATDSPNHIEVARYTETGELEYKLPFFTTQMFDRSRPFRIMYDSHMLFTTIRQGDTTIRFQAKLHALTHDLTRTKSSDFPKGTYLIPASQ